MGPEIIQTDRVLLLHGLAAGARSMRTLERALNAAGYGTLNFAYPSCRLSLRDLVGQVHACPVWMQGGDGTLHVVTYSMGGLLARAAIAQKRPPNLGRVVMLAPPNGGSEVADLLRGWALYRRLFGPAGAELGTRQSDGLERLLGRVDYPLGIIAGDRFLDPMGWMMIPGRNDGRVSVERTRLDGMADHLTIHATHHGMVRNRHALDQVVRFLGSGRFERPGPCGRLQNPRMMSPASVKLPVLVSAL